MRCKPLPLPPAATRGRKRHINIWHINNFSVTPVTDPPAGYPDKNVYLPWVPHTAHKLLTPGHRSGDPWPPGRETPPTRAVAGKICLCLCAFSFPEQLRDRRCISARLGVVLPHLLGEICLVNVSRLFRHSFGSFSQISVNFIHFCQSQSI